MTITTVLVDDHHLVRQALRRLLQAEPGIEVVGEAADGLEALDVVERLRPRVLVVDLMLPGLTGLGVVRQVVKRWPETAVVVLSMHANEAYVTEALRGGARGYVLKEAEVEELVTAIRHAAAGKRYLSSDLSERAIAAYERVGRGGKALVRAAEDLSPREEEVLLHTISGATSAQIAERLFISPRTVEKHRANVMRKLGLRTHHELLLYAVARGLLPAAPPAE